MDTPARQPGAEPGVLVVDDSAVDRMLLVHMLEVLGVVADTVHDGRQAMQVLSERDYTVVLMDVRMPHADGYSVAAWLRARETDRRTGVIGVSAGDSLEDRQRGAESGMDDFLVKPVALADLRRVLARHLLLEAATPAPREQVVDVDRLAVLVDQLADVDLVHDIVATYLTELPGRRSGLQAAVGAVDRDTVHLLSHSLKSSSALVGATTLAGACADLERLATEGAPDALSACLMRIEELAPETVSTLERWLAGD